MDTTIGINSMKDGDIGVIVAWTTQTYIGRYVQRYDKHLIAIGLPSDYSWTNLFEHALNDTKHRVQLTRLDLHIKDNIDAKVQENPPAR